MRALGGKGVLSDAFLGGFNCSVTPALPAPELELALQCAYGDVAADSAMAAPALAAAESAFVANCQLHPVLRVLLTKDGHLSAAAAPALAKVSELRPLRAQ